MSSTRLRACLRKSQHAGGRRSSPQRVGWPPSHFARARDSTAVRHRRYKRHPDDSSAQHRIRGPLRQRRDRDAAWRARPQLQARGREGPVGRKRVRQRRRRPLGMLVPRLERDQHPAADLEQAERARRPAEARDRRRRPRRRPPALRGHGPRARAPDPLLTRGGHRRARHAATPHRDRRSSACGR